MKEPRNLSTHEVFIACPVCYSGGHFQLEPPGRELACEDCGFVLAESLAPDIMQSEECVFCGSRNFYFEFTLPLFFLGRDSVCYVCEARYRRTRINHPDDKYSEAVSGGAQRAQTAVRWKERVEQYEQQAG